MSATLDRLYAALQLVPASDRAAAIALWKRVREARTDVDLHAAVYDASLLASLHPAAKAKLEEVG